MGRSLDVDDPLAAAIAPPSNETSHERAVREEHEARAKKTSDEIDEMLRAERVAARRRKKPVKVLLLGQSESGKSTTLKSEFLRSCVLSLWGGKCVGRQCGYSNACWTCSHMSDCVRSHCLSHCLST
jgi:hypothetical protein